MKRKIAAIVAADIAGYSKLVAEDEEETLRRLASYRAVFEDFVTRFSGRIFNTAGDAVLAEFPSAVEAVRCAIDVQESVRTRNLAYPASRPMSFRIGITIGDVVERDGDLLGDGVNIAARLEGLAQPGGLCVSRTVYEQVANKLSVEFVDIGEQAVKNIPTPIHAYTLILGSEDPRLQGAPPKQRKATTGSAAIWPIAITAASVAVLAVIGLTYPTITGTATPSVLSAAARVVGLAAQSDRQPSTPRQSEPQVAASTAPDRQQAAPVVADRQSAASIVSDRPQAAPVAQDRQRAVSLVPDREQAAPFVPDRQPAASIVPDRQQAAPVVADRQPSIVPDRQQAALESERAFAPDPTAPCAQIRQACELAGFVQGAMRDGSGLQVNCIRPIMRGTPQPVWAPKPLPHIDPHIVEACRARNANFGDLPLRYSGPVRPLMPGRYWGRMRP
jgi:class 3 adenylate cyclase